MSDAPSGASPVANVPLIPKPFMDMEVMGMEAMEVMAMEVMAMAPTDMVAMDMAAVGMAAMAMEDTEDMVIITASGPLTPKPIMDMEVMATVLEMEDMLTSSAEGEAINCY